MSNPAHHYAELARLAAAASRLLLNPPDAATLAALQPGTDVTLDLAQSQQDFYDHLCIAQSGCFLPPVAHVLSQAHQTKAFWHFGTPRHDGGDALLPWYDAIEFDPAALPADPFLAAANRPLDHTGVLLAFLAVLLDAAHDDEADRTLIGEFIGEHIEPWSGTFADLLSCSASPYIALLGSMLGDFFEVLCDAIPPIAPTAIGTQPKVIAIQPTG